MSDSAHRHTAVDAVDTKRQELEANINKLRGALQHWQKSEIDYGEFQEKLEDAPDAPSFEDLKGIRDSIDATLINDQEVHELLGSDKGIRRGRDQINDVIARRVDYVQQNSRSLQKQLDSAETELHKLSGDEAERLEDGNFDDEQGLPITEILEELDDDGNVISGKTSTAQEAAAGAAGLLSKAGIKEWVDPSSDSGLTKLQEAHHSPISAEDEAQRTGALPAGSKQADSRVANTSKRKKSVAFAADLDIAPAPPRRNSSPPPVRSTSPPPTALPPTPIKSKPSVPWEVAESRRGRFHSGTRVIELNEDDNEIGSLPVVPPEDFQETEEEARLRREMTEYALNEVGAIVAEMDLEDEDAYDDEELGSDLDGARDFGSDDEDENEFGMTAFDRISDEDRKQMLELEKKLEAKVMQNIGPESMLDNTDVDINDVRRLVVNTGETANGVDSHRRSSKVHFADEEDVQATPMLPASGAGTEPAVKSAIVERRDGATSAKEPTAPTKQPPRASMSRQGTPSIPVHMRDQQSPQERPSPPTGLSGQVLSSTVLERSSLAKTVLPPDEMGTDPALIQQELAVENRRLFNKMVQQQGGFKPSPEDEDNPLMEERDGKVRKVSRFKAARINNGGI